MKTTYLLTRKGAWLLLVAFFQFGLNQSTALGQTKKVNCDWNNWSILTRVEKYAYGHNPYTLCGANNTTDLHIRNISGLMIDISGYYKLADGTYKSFADPAMNPNELMKGFACGRIQSYRYYVRPMDASWSCPWPAEIKDGQLIQKSQESTTITTNSGISSRNLENGGASGLPTNSSSGSTATDQVIMNGIDMSTGKPVRRPDKAQSQAADLQSQQNNQVQHQQAVQLRQQDEAGLQQAEAKLQLDIKSQQYQNLLSQAATYESAGNLTMARSQYQQALQAAPTSTDQANARARLATIDQAIAQKAETERQNQVAAKNEQNQQAAQNLNNLQADETGLFLLIAAAPVLLLFDHLGNNGPRSQYIKPAIRLSGHLGYSYQSFPAYSNSAENVYTGSASQTTIKTGSGQISTPNIEGGGEFWPFYSRVFGAGYFANGNYGLWFKDKNWGLENGLKAFLGHSNLQLIGEYRYGYRHFEHNEQTATNGGTSTAKSNDITSSGDYNFLRIGAGLRLNWNAHWGNETRGHLDLMYLQESFPDSKVLTAKQVGYSAMLWFDDRLCFYGNYFPNYYRTGEVKGSTFSADLNGSMLRVGFYRTFDVFGGKR